VEITATTPTATSVKIAESVAGSPTDADVRAIDAITAPFTKLFPAPDVGETLYAGAFAYAGTTESARANTRSPEPSSSTCPNET
jgi:hypothetical protein